MGDWKEEISKVQGRTSKPDEKPMIQKNDSKHSQPQQKNMKFTKHGGKEMVRRVLPLYKDLMYDDTNPRCMEGESTANTGLIFDKFPDIWSGPHGDPPWKPKKDDGTKKQFLDKIVKHFNQNDDVKDLLKQCNERRQLLLENCAGRSKQYKTSWRFVSGLGMGHVLETGFVWHRIYGVPYLPGSSVKGLMRAYDEQSSKSEEKAKEITRLFGPGDNEAKTKPSAGSLIVFDAIPVTKPKLEVDIMNPHYGDYYGKKKVNGQLVPPADYLSPVPIFFLTVAKDAVFSFAIGVRKSGTDEDVEIGFDLLTKALDALGAGGKTAVGYGYMDAI